MWFPPVRVGDAVGHGLQHPGLLQPADGQEEADENRTVFQSTRRSRWRGQRLTSRVRMAAMIPTVATVRPVWAWVMSRTTTTRKRDHMDGKLPRLWMESLGSSSITFCLGLGSQLCTCLRKQK